MAKNNNETITTQLIEEIKEALSTVKFGSIEIFIQNKIVTQITVRNIRKTSVGLAEEQGKETIMDSDSMPKKHISMR